MKKFEGFSPASRIWVYQNNRPFSDNEVTLLHESSKIFAEDWSAHNDKLKAATEILYNRFIIFCVDENVTSASGCSIDKSIHYIKQVEKDFNVFLMNRQLIAYKLDDKILSSPLNVFVELFHQNKINADTVVFNNLVDTLNSFQESWETPLKNCWIYQHIQTEKAF